MPPGYRRLKPPARPKLGPFIIRRVLLLLRSAGVVGQNLVASIARGRRWLDELTSDATASAEIIAAREGCSVRKVNMTISLAFLAPDLVKAAVKGSASPRHGSCSPRRFTG